MALCCAAVLQKGRHELLGDAWAKGTPVVYTRCNETEGTAQRPGALPGAMSLAGGRVVTP